MLLPILTSLEAKAIDRQKLGYADQFSLSHPYTLLYQFGLSQQYPLQQPTKELDALPRAEVRQVPSGKRDDGDVYVRYQNNERIMAVAAHRRGFA
jgi:hypothetical protein